MTPKQEARIRNKIKMIKAALAADKKDWGGQYNDGRGLRYLPPQHYIQLNGFAGAMRYFNWFKKNFPDDSAYPDFLFEYTLVLFKAGKLKEAEKKAFETFCSLPFLFDLYFGRPVQQFQNNTATNLPTTEASQPQFYYSSTQPNLLDFSNWLNTFITSDKFVVLSNKFLDIQKRLRTEKDSETKYYLTQHRNQLINEF